MSTQPTFEIVVAEEYELRETLLVGLSSVAMVGVTAVDYLVRHLESEEIGHVATRELPDIAPFSNGEPRYPMRLYDVPDADLTVLVCELFVPVWAADAFADSLFAWVADDVENVTIAHGVPFPHGPDEHRVFHVSTPAFRARLEDQDVPPLGGGFFDGVVGELVTRALDDELPLGVLVTPSHPPGPDLDAALLLLGALQSTHDFAVNEEELKQLSEEMKRYYTELADRMKALGEGDQSIASRDYPEDRMYM